ncbi:hypothetical protein P154DRAFT_419329 [Amniculicola lignicola CBS 123094]|uniref:Aminoglycoside phosphotransferase domain-containing protein n=1 Tax=Amniculicola lignicola CBS 123094 TaxID=1392246 RepID=A0A6A5X464_9PLEO|nr:hypothetical protein P154DRAFT_419329 [Amniculicola lignicola CBS 123094]
MHLPPLDVAVYPVVTMGHGRHGGRKSRAQSSISSTSSSSSASSSQSIQPDFSSIQKVIRNVFRSSKIQVQQIERLRGRIHQVYLSRLADGSSLVLKCPPDNDTRLLRHEKYGLETERTTLETLREYTQLPVPQVIKYDNRGDALGSAFLMMSHVPGRRLSELSPYLSVNERRTIDYTLGAYIRTLTSLSATQFGLTHRVFAGKGSSSWREAFIALLESVLRDAEDMLVTLPYDTIRYYIQQHISCLDEVTEPRLVALHACELDNVMIDVQTKQVTGLVGFSSVVWGDPLLSGGVADGSEAFFEGLGENPVKTGGVKARMLMYATYRSLLEVTAHHYRPRHDMDDLQGRRALTHALNELGQV